MDLFILDILRLPNTALPVVSVGDVMTVLPDPGMLPSSPIMTPGSLGLDVDIALPQDSIRLRPTSASDWDFPSRPELVNDQLLGRHHDNGRILFILSPNLPVFPISDPYQSRWEAWSFPRVIRDHRIIQVIKLLGAQRLHISARL